MDTSRRDFIKSATLAAGTFLLSGSCTSVARNDKRRGKRPNLVYVFADQWRAQDAGFAGNNDVITENIDKLASESWYLSIRCLACQYLLLIVALC